MFVEYNFDGDREKSSIDIQGANPRYKVHWSSVR